MEEKEKCQQRKCESWEEGEVRLIMWYVTF